VLGGQFCVVVCVLVVVYCKVGGLYVLLWYVFSVSEGKSKEKKRGAQRDEWANQTLVAALFSFQSTEKGLGRVGKK
jgi:hypothetical protein